MLYEPEAKAEANAATPKAEAKAQASAPQPLARDNVKVPAQASRIAPGGAKLCGGTAGRKRARSIFASRKRFRFVPFHFVSFPSPMEDTWESNVYFKEVLNLRRFLRSHWVLLPPPGSDANPLTPEVPNALDEAEVWYATPEPHYNPRPDHGEGETDTDSDLSLDTHSIQEGRLAPGGP